MACFEVDTVYFAINSSFYVQRNTTGKCDTTEACAQAYCELNNRRGVDWICFSASQANEIIHPSDTWSILLYTALALLALYSIVITFMYLRHATGRDNPAVEETEPLFGKRMYDTAQ